MSLAGHCEYFRDRDPSPPSHPRPSLVLLEARRTINGKKIIFFFNVVFTKSFGQQNFEMKNI